MIHLDRLQHLYDQALSLIIQLQHCDAPDSQYERLYRKAQDRLIRRGDALQQLIDAELAEDRHAS